MLNQVWVSYNYEMRHLLMLILFVTSTAFAGSIFPAIDNEYQGEVLDFINDSNGKVGVRQFGTLTIGSARLSWSDPDSKSGVIGLCYWLPLGPNRIEIDSQFWTVSEDISRKALMYHELGHCVCSRDHTPVEAEWLIGLLNSLGVEHIRSTKLFDGCPKSLMHPYLPSEDCLKRHWGHYKEELFKSCVPDSWIFRSI